MYMSEFVDHGSESVEKYWNRKKMEYPSLVEVAACVFSTIPSEAVCESSFSVTGYLLDKCRTRLQYTRAELIVLGSQIASEFPSFLD
uniref:Dimer_Tnp_hAT domain-containing protein n=2 Tax=Caenorhabditis japonica TaxID=281687 RepID=A0A8R1EG22_CAEJA